MKIAAIKERTEGEARVAITPDAVKKYVSLGVQVAVEQGAGKDSHIDDAQFTAAGATVGSTVDTLKNADILLTVRTPDSTIIKALPEGANIVGMLDPYRLDEVLPFYSERKLNTFALELLPRISRAQSMDVLSSQTNLAGYRAVIEAVCAFNKAVPMMMTAAGTVAPAKALVLGAGVAGLQAIATAKRLGAVVSAFDVRPVVKEQVESLGAKFVEVTSEETGETKGGYAKEMSEDYKNRQHQLIHDTIVKQDIVIATALIPGKPAPTLISEDMVKGMRGGAVIVDLAVASGGNCPLSELDQVVVKYGVTLIGYSNMPARVAVDASQLYARNLYNFVSAMLIDNGALAPKWDDELIKGTMLTKNGAVMHEQFK